MIVTFVWIHQLIWVLRTLLFVFYSSIRVLENVNTQYSTRVVEPNTLLYSSTEQNMTSLLYTITEHLWMLYSTRELTLVINNQLIVHSKDTY